MAGAPLPRSPPSARTCPVERARLEREVVAYERGVADAERRRGGSIRLLERATTPTRVAPGVVLDADGELVAADAQPAGGTRYRRGTILGVN
jgi:hypothetical protein